MREKSLSNNDNWSLLSTLVLMFEDLLITTWQWKGEKMFYFWLNEEKRIGIYFSDCASLITFHFSLIGFTPATIQMDYKLLCCIWSMLTIFACGSTALNYHNLALRDDNRLSSDNSSIILKSIVDAFRRKCPGEQTFMMVLLSIGMHYTYSLLAAGGPKLSVFEFIGVGMTLLLIKFIVSHILRWIWSFANLLRNNL